MKRKPRGKTVRYSINYDFIYGEGNKPCWRCGKITRENYYCRECVK